MPPFQPAKWAIREFVVSPDVRPRRQHGPKFVVDPQTGSNPTRSAVVQRAASTVQSSKLPSTLSEQDSPRTTPDQPDYGRQIHPAAHHPSSHGPRRTTSEIRARYARPARRNTRKLCKQGRNGAKGRPVEMVFLFLAFEAGPGADQRGEPARLEKELCGAGFGGSAVVSKAQQWLGPRYATNTEQNCLKASSNTIKRRDGLLSRLRLSL